MTQRIATTKEALEHIKILLTEDQAQRQQLAYNLHGKKSVISAVALHLTQIRKDLLKGKKVDPELLQGLCDELYNFTDDLQAINSGISPSRVYSLGLRVTLLAYTHTLKNNTGVDVTLDCSSLDSMTISKASQAAIYRACTSILDYLAITGCNSIDIAISLSQFHLDILIVGNTPRKRKKEIIEFDRKLSSIKALLIWQEATLLPFNNWKTSFGFRYSIKKLSDGK